MRATHLPQSQAFESLVSSLVSVWAELGSVTLLEEVCHWGWALKFKKPVAIPSSFSPLAASDSSVSSQLFLLSCLIATLTQCEGKQWIFIPLEP